MGQFFASGGQSIGVSASTSVLPMNIKVMFTLYYSLFNLYNSIMALKNHFIALNEKYFIAKNAHHRLNLQ